MSDQGSGGARGGEPRSGDARAGAPRDDAAMADILASIRRIVSEEEKSGAVAARASAEAGDVLVLTEEMRLDRPTAAATAAEPQAAPPEAASPGEEPPGPLSIDEAHVADIARAVIHQELKGEFGKILTRNLRALVREEIARSLADRDGGPR